MVDLKSVVKKIYEIAREFYNNDVQTYIQSIYHRLNDEEQHVLLKGLVPYLFEVESPPQAIAARHRQLENEFDIETYSQVEMIRLKSWFVKCAMILVSVLISLAFIYLIINSFVPAQKESIAQEVINFLKTLLGTE